MSDVIQPSARYIERMHVLTFAGVATTIGAGSFSRTSAPSSNEIFFVVDALVDDEPRAPDGMEMAGVGMAISSNASLDRSEDDSET